MQASQDQGADCGLLRQCVAVRGRPVLTFDAPARAGQRQIWAVGALCRAIADALEARFNPVAVRGEISGFSRASSGHCYFSIKDAQGQLRCAMFRRAASLLDFSPRDGELVELQGRLGVYEPRGDLQLIVESMSRAGQGSLFEQFLQLKQRLETEGLFSPERKRPVPVLPRAIGIVTSLGAAALHDVVAALRRRAPHVPVVIAPAAVQGSTAPAELIAALGQLYGLAQSGLVQSGPVQNSPTQSAGGAPLAAAPPVDVILLVRGGGSIDDLWAFNHEALARTILQSPVPVVCGVGHETDFTIADFVADLRAPTPTAAAELAAAPQQAWLQALSALESRLQDSMYSHLDRHNQHLDRAAARLGRPSALAAQQQLRLAGYAQQLRHAMLSRLQSEKSVCAAQTAYFSQKFRHNLTRNADRLARAAVRLEMLDPTVVLRRGYALLTDSAGHAVTSIHTVRPGNALRATLADGGVDLTVSRSPPHARNVL